MAFLLNHGWNYGFCGKCKLRTDCMVRRKGWDPYVWARCRHCLGTYILCSNFDNTLSDCCAQTLSYREARAKYNGLDEIEIIWKYEKPDLIEAYPIEITHLIPTNKMEEKEAEEMITDLGKWVDEHEEKMDEYLVPKKNIEIHATEAKGVEDDTYFGFCGLCTRCGKWREGIIWEE